MPNCQDCDRYGDDKECKKCMDKQEMYADMEYERQREEGIC